MLEAEHPPQTIVITVQKEVAQRIIAKPGQLSILAISVQLYGQPTYCHTIPANAFVPPPKVDSAVLRIDRHKTPPIDVPDTDLFFRVVKAGFSQKRKQLKNSLSAGLRQPQTEVVAWLEAAGIDPSRRAQDALVGGMGSVTARKLILFPDPVTDPQQATLVRTRVAFLMQVMFLFGCTLQPGPELQRRVQQPMYSDCTDGWLPSVFT